MRNAVVDLVIIIVCESLALAFVLLSVQKQVLRKYGYLSLYAAFMLVFDYVRLTLQHAYGQTSQEFLLAYYFTDFNLVLLKCLAILGLLEVSVQDFPWRIKPLFSSLFRVALMVALSAVFVVHYIPTLYRRTTILELERDLQFLAAALVALLWLALFRSGSANRELQVLACGLGLGSAQQACAWALLGRLPNRHWITDVVGYQSAVATTLMFVLWCYALTHFRIPVGASANSADIVTEVLDPALAQVGSRG
jgi:hypothetical protein